MAACCNLQIVVLILEYLHSLQLQGLPHKFVHEKSISDRDLHVFFTNSISR